MTNIEFNIPFLEKCVRKAMTTFFLCLLTLLAAGYAFRLVPSSLRMNKWDWLDEEISRNQQSTNEDDIHPLFIGNLPFTITSGDLLQLVQEKGLTEIKEKDVRIVVDKKLNRSRGFAYIDFSTTEKAQDALNTLTNMVVGERMVKLDIAETIAGPNKGRRPSLYNQNYSLFIGNINFQSTNQDVYYVVNKILNENPSAQEKPILFRVRIAVYKDKSKGIGHIDFTNDSDMMKALEILPNKLTVNERLLTVEKAAGKVVGSDEKRSSKLQSDTIFVGNLPFNMNKEIMKEMLLDVVSPSIAIKRISIAEDRITNRSKGYGHVQFETYDDALFALEKLDGLECMGRELRVDMAVNRDSPSLD